MAKIPLTEITVLNSLLHCQEHRRNDSFYYDCGHMAHLTHVSLDVQQPCHNQNIQWTYAVTALPSLCNN